MRDIDRHRGIKQAGAYLQILAASPWMQIVMARQLLVSFELLDSLAHLEPPSGLAACSTRSGSRSPGGDRDAAMYTFNATP